MTNGHVCRSMKLLTCYIVAVYLFVLIFECRVCLHRNMSDYTTCKVAELRQLCNDRGIACGGLRKHELIEALRKNDDEVYFRVLRDDNDNDDDDVEYAENNHPNHASNNDVGYDNASDDGDYSDNDDDDDYDDAEDAVAGGDDLGEDHQEQGGYVTDGAGGDRPARDSPLSYTAGRRTSREIELQIQLERERRETMRLKWDVERDRIEMRRNNGTMPASDARSNVSSDIAHLKSLLPVMVDSDVITFFLTFEKVCDLHDIDKGLWERLLTPQLTPQAMKVFLRLSSADAKNYDTAKRAILAYYKLSAQTYLKEFRSLKRTGKDTYGMTLNKLKDMQLAYFEAKGIKTFEDLADANLQEQLLNSLPNDVREYVWSKEPKSAEDSARQADLYYDVTRINDTIPKYSFWSRDAMKQSNGFSARPDKPPLGARPRRREPNNGLRNGNQHFSRPHSGRQRPPNAHQQQHERGNAWGTEEALR